MSTYKMIQDIEAEDKILGPLTLRQFIYGLIAALLLYINFLCITKHVPFLVVLFLPPAIFCGFFAFPFGGDQPTEVWALAKIRFLFKPRRRIWDQSGVKELVTVTVPKRIERNLTNGLTQVEVKSRLSALANTIDSRGWAVKNVNVNMFANPASFQDGGSDRLIDVASLPREVPNYDVQASDDILDEQNNSVAQQFDQMINASSQAHHQQLINQMNGAAQPAQPLTPTTPADYWFLNQNAASPQLPADQTTFRQSIVLPTVPASSSLSQMTPTLTPATDYSDDQYLAELKAHAGQQDISNAHLHTLMPTGSEQAMQPQTQFMQLMPPAAPASQMQTPPAVTPVTAGPTPSDAAILSLASNNDLNVATLAREAQKAQDNDGADGEVVIALR